MSNAPLSHGRFREIQYANKFNLTDPMIISEAESLLTTMAIVEGMPQGTFDASHLKQMHKHLLGDMYEWAGEYRDNDLMVGGSASVGGAKASDIELEVDAILSKSQVTPYANMSRLTFAEHMASLYADLYRVSPFPDGNARTARAFVDTLAEKHGMQIDWGNVPGEAFTTAVDQAMHGDNDSLNKVMSMIVQPMELYDLHLLSTIKKKAGDIVERAGLAGDLLPTAQIETADDLAKLARHAKLTLVKSLTDFSQSGKSVLREWDRSSIKHGMDNNLDRASGSSMLKSFITNMDTGQPDAGQKGPRV